VRVSAPSLDCSQELLGEHCSLRAPPQRADEAESISKVLEYVYLGSWKDADDLELMQREKITHVLNIAKECEKPPASPATLGLAWKVLPVSDQIESASALMEHLQEAFIFIDSAKRVGGRCLVHCRRGISRSPTVVIAYLMHSTGRRYDDCKTQVESCRKIGLNLGFHSMLQEFVPLTEKFIDKRSICPSDTRLLVFGSAESPISLPRTDTESTLEPSSAESTSNGDLLDICRQMNYSRATLFPTSPSNAPFFT